MLDIHKARIFDIASGIGASLDTASKIITLRNLELLKKAVRDFRSSFVDAATPAMHILDMDADILNPISKAYPGVDRSALEVKVRTNLDKITTKVNVSVLVTKIKQLATNANQEFADIIKNSEGLTGTQLHNKYRQVTRNLGINVGNLFPKQGMLMVEDPATLGQPGKLVFMAKSFKNLRDTNLNKAINTALAEVGISDNIGKYRVLGHTAVAFSDSYRINTPLLTETLIRLEAGGLTTRQGRLAKEDEFVKAVPLFLKYKIDFTENFSSAADTLLDIGFSFSVGMDPEENARSGSSDEIRARNKIVAGMIFPELVETLKKRVSWLKENVLRVKNSPNLLEYYQELVISALKNQKPKSYKDKSSKSGSKKLGKTPLVQIPSVSKKTNKVKATPRNKVTVSPLGEESVSNLQAILNLSLREQIEKNMGTGDRKDVLNYRTGRFADSVKITGISQSREGMITAFYTYMKNPYATFSAGGRQEYPKTRDPKLLISKSIREIAAQQAYNRMRAVLV